MTNKEAARALNLSSRQIIKRIKKKVKEFGPLGVLQGNKPSALTLGSDDATGKPLYGIFQKQEDLDGCFRVCLEVFKRYGLDLRELWKR